MSISEEILAIILVPDASAHAIWTSLEGLFRNNKTTHALSLKAEFHNFAQGDQTILAYCQRLKSFADALADLGQLVSEDTLILTMLCGLSEPFRNIATVIKTKMSFPKFLNAHSFLEASLKITVHGPSTALVATTSATASGHSTGYGIGSKSSSINVNGGKNKGRNNCRGDDDSGSSNTGNSAPTFPWS